MFIGLLHYMQWITVNFKKIDEDALGLWFRAKRSAQDTGLVARMKRILIRTVPLLGGFSAGFYFGFLHE